MSYGTMCARGRYNLDVASLPWCLAQPDSGLRGSPAYPAEHEGPISSVRLSPDGLHVLSTTSSGHLGFLDIPSREYSVLMRSHTALVLALAIECSRGQLATVSRDQTVRIWDLATLQQVGGGLEEGTGGSQATLKPGGQGPDRWGMHGEGLRCPWSFSLCLGSMGSRHLRFF